MQPTDYPPDHLCNTASGFFTMLDRGLYRNHAALVRQFESGPYWKMHSDGLTDRIAIGDFHTRRMGDPRMTASYIFDVDGTAIRKLDLPVELSSIAPSFSKKGLTLHGLDKDGVVRLIEDDGSLLVEKRAILPLSEKDYLLSRAGRTYLKHGEQTGDTISEIRADMSLRPLYSGKVIDDFDVDANQNLFVMERERKAGLCPITFVDVHGGERKEFGDGWGLAQCHGAAVVVSRPDFAYQYDKDSHSFRKLAKEPRLVGFLGNRAVVFSFTTKKQCSLDLSPSKRNSVRAFEF